MGFPSGSDGKESACNTEDAGDTCSIPGLGRSPEEGNGSPLRYSCLENPMDRGAWQATVHGAAESDTTGQLTLLLIQRRGLWEESGDWEGKEEGGSAPCRHQRMTREPHAV